jgi:hypothetical protein
MSSRRRLLDVTSREPPMISTPSTGVWLQYCWVVHVASCPMCLRPMCSLFPVLSKTPLLHSWKKMANAHTVAAVCCCVPATKPAAPHPWHVSPMCAHMSCSHMPCHVSMCSCANLWHFTHTFAAPCCLSVCRYLRRICTQRGKQQGVGVGAGSCRSCYCLQLGGRGAYPLLDPPCFQAADFKLRAALLAVGRQQPVTAAVSLAIAMFTRVLFNPAEATVAHGVS